MSGVDQKALGTLLNNIEGLTGLFETLIEAEIIANESATVQAQNASTSAAAAATSAASVTSLAATVAATASTAVSAANNAGTDATNAGASANTATTQATNAASAATAAQAAAAAAQAVQTGLQTIYTLNTTGGAVALNATQAAAGIIWVQGALQSNLTIVMPATVHPFVLDNATTGTYSVTVVMSGGSASCTVGQGNANQLFCDGNTGIYSVSSVSGLQFTGVKAISGATNNLSNQYQGAYTPMSNSSGSTYVTTLPQGASMGVGGAVFLDAISGKWSVVPFSGDTADFGASFPMGVADKAMFTWNGSSWRTTLYSNQQSPVFSISLTVPVAFITRGVFGGVTDDGTTAVQATSGRFTTSLTVPTVSTTDNSANAASTAFVYAVVNNLIGGAPGNLDTLNELAQAINDDTSFAATVTNLIAAKAAISGQVFTGQVSAPSLVATGGYVSAYGWGSNNQNGMLYLSQNGANYLLWDGTNYNMPNGNLKVNGSTVWTAATFNPANYAALANAATFGGAVTGTAQVGALVATSTGTNQTSIQLKQPGAATDQKTWELIFLASGGFKLRTANDAYTNEYDAISLARGTGYTVSTMTLMGQGGRILTGAAVDDTYTPTQVANGLAIQRIGGGGQQLMLSAASLNYLPGSVQTNNEITSYSAAGNAKSLMLNATTDMSDTPLTAGSLGISFLIYSQQVALFNSAGRFLVNTSADDGSNVIQLQGGIGIKGASNGITFPDGTKQTTGYAVTAPTVNTYTPLAGATVVPCQNYGLNLIQVFEGGSYLVPGVDYTANTGNSITLTSAANGRNSYTIITGMLFNASNVIQPNVAVIPATVGNTTLTLPAAATVGYLWIFLNGSWLIPNVDYTFNGGTSVTLSQAPTQTTDTFTAIMLQPISFANTATQTNVQAAQLTFATDTGAVNAYAVAYIPAVATPTNGMQLSFFVSHTNTGASTLACNGGTTYAIYGNGHAQLSGGELVAGGFVEVVFNTTLGVWILLENTGGAQQIVGNLNFVGTTQRITGDMSNATVANRLWFQTSTPNTYSATGVMPNGTGSEASVVVTNNSNPTNAPFFGLDITTTAALVSGAWGSGTPLPVTFNVNGAERMRIATTGQVLVGNSVQAGISGAWAGILQVYTTANTVRQTIQGHANNQGYGTAYINGAEAGTYANAIMFLNSSGSTVGNVTVTTSATAYNTTSDYRLKEAIKPLKGALDRVMATRVVNYIFRNDTNRHVQDGFLAHELQEHHPRAVTGEKDSVHRSPVLRDGHDPKNVQPEDVLGVDEYLDPQLVDHSKLVPTLWAAVQELKRALDEARAEIAALKQQKR